MSNSTAHLVHRPHLPHPDLHRVADAVHHVGDAVHHVGEKAHAVLEHEEKHECKRYGFFENALMSREWDHL